ncbi:alpha/beta fold hydrolase [Piscinibacter terrae]|uniref:Alpha/beta fold hydrolase n=1 Tax=Piscinibacter terrae TaxID=2496871 RepID=A0A3N7HM07_9BURK|nr:alpha/beta fold hydrolase [Albitalea terrae]RQP23178.1 alpha/beta fold hydrolase [Albitalea terrae]
MNTPASSIPLALLERGDGPHVLVLHGGAGPLSVAAFVETMSARAHVVAPTHPGFAGTERPEALDSIGKLADAYARLIEDRGWRDVLVIGFSIGGWIAAELALRAAERLRGVVLVDAAGIEVAGEPVADVFSMSPRELSTLSYADADRFFVDPATFPPERLAAMAANFRALAVYGRALNMADPTLAPRLAKATTPALLVWGANDGVTTPAYGRRFAQAWPGSRFELIERCGHLPQIEQPQALMAAIESFEEALRR